MTGFWLGCCTVTVKLVCAEPPRVSCTLTVIVALPGAFATS